MAAGFLLLAIAEAVMSGGNAAGQIEGQAAFGAGLALYLPALWLISSGRNFPIAYSDSLVLPQPFHLVLLRQKYLWVMMYLQLQHCLERDTDCLQLLLLDGYGA